MEGELETLRQATGKEEREKADILSAEKKARVQVKKRTLERTNVLVAWTVADRHWSGSLQFVENTNIVF